MTKKLSQFWMMIMSDKTKINEKNSKQHCVPFMSEFRFWRIVHTAYVTTFNCLYTRITNKYFIIFNTHKKMLTIQFLTLMKKNICTKQCSVCKCKGPNISGLLENFKYKTESQIYSWDVRVRMFFFWLIFQLWTVHNYFQQICRAF